MQREGVAPSGDPFPRRWGAANLWTMGVLGTPLPFPISSPCCGEHKHQAPQAVRETSHRPPLALLYVLCSHPMKTTYFDLKPGTHLMPAPKFSVMHKLSLPTYEPLL